MLRRNPRWSRIFAAVGLGALVVGIAGCGSNSGGAAAKDFSTWDDVLAAAKGQTVNLYMWGGSEVTNSYVDKQLAGAVSQYGVKINRVPVNDTKEAVNKVLGEKQAGRNEGGSVDLIWVNGENFRTGKQAKAWRCGYTDLLPNNKLVDWNDPSVANDFGTPVEKCEVPWSKAQFALAYDSAKLSNPPRTMADLLTWIKANPGRFTYPAPPDFTGSVFVRHVFYNAAGGYKDLLGPFNDSMFHEVAPKTWAALNGVKSSLWRAGKTYPESIKSLDDLYANGEVDFTMSYTPSEIANAVGKGRFPKTTRTLVLQEGTIGNTNYLGVPYNAKNAAGAIVVANAALSFEQQLEKAKPSVWGAYPAIAMGKLGPEQQKQIAEIPVPESALSYAQLTVNSNPELQSEWLTNIEQGWQQEVLRK